MGDSKTLSTDPVFEGFKGEDIALAIRISEAVTVISIIKENKSVSLRSSRVNQEIFNERE